MERNASINVRIEGDVKERAEAVFSELGLSTATAINAFFRQVVMRQDMPFPMQIVTRPRNLAEMTPEEISEALAQADADMKAGRTYTEAELEARFREQGRI